MLAEEAHAIGGAHEGQEEPWTFQMFISVLSGLIGSLLSATAFSRQREVSKGRANGKSLPQLRASADGLSGGARIVQQLGGSLLDAEARSPLFSLGPVPRCTEASDLRRSDRHFTIITTAALPWLTGTAVNPLLRALALAQSGRPTVLMLPWLGEADQSKLFPNGQTFDNAEMQEAAVAKWCRERAKIEPDELPLRFRWYSAKYVHNVRSIFPTGDVSRDLGHGDPKDVLILEEPEHLCWYHHGQRWPTLFKHVIGIVHTNYQDYLISKTIAGDGYGGGAWPDEFKEASVFAASTMVCSAYCDVNIKLSDTIMPLPNEVTCNVHGVRQEFLMIGNGCSEREAGPVAAYYLGKASFEKGWKELLDLLESAGEGLAGVEVDGYGSGSDYERIIRRADALGDNAASLNMHPGIDHGNEVIHPYAVLVNPSTTDVLCTVTVEALAMGKRCVLARHPSNNFFEENFAERCHFFTVGDTGSFVAALREALAAGPAAMLPPEQRYTLTWEAASERLFTAAEVRVLSGRYQRPSEAAASRLAYRLHNDVMQDKSVMADLIKEATLGEKTPWDEYLAEWRRTSLGKLRAQAKKVAQDFRPDHLQEHEGYLKERVEELKSVASALLPGDSGSKKA